MDQKTDQLIKTQAYINGAWAGSPVTEVLDKASGEVIAKVADCGRVETREAIAAAKAAMPAWAKRTAKERSFLLRKWFDLIVAHQHELALILSREQGKPKAEAIQEIQYGAGFVEFFAEEAKRVYGEIIPSHKADGRILVLKQPIGVVAAITPWNFPNAMITRKVTPALAAGCTAVVKPAEATPLSALALGALAEEAGLPPGIFNVVTASDPEPVGAEMCENPDVAMVTFTGSTEVGKLLLRQCAGTVKKTLGGNAPLIVFDDADLERAIQSTMVSKFRNAGQTCVCANRIYVQGGIHDAFVRRLVEETRKLKVGPGLQEGVTIGPLIEAAAVEKVGAHIVDAVAAGAKVETGGRRHSLGGTFFEPTVLSSVSADMQIARYETFGPVAPVIRFETEDDVIASANATRFGLASYVFTADVGRVWRMAEALEYGIVGVNEGVVSTELAPFGGVKESGLGREGSHYGIEECVEVKYVYLGGLG